MIKYPLAVTIDTNIFDSAKYDLSEKSTLSLLIDFVKRGKIKVVLSHIVIEEAKCHLAEQTKKVLSISRNIRSDILKESTEYLVKYLGLTLFCDSEIVVDCFYKDYDNAPWDSSIKDYTYVDTINISDREI